VLVTFQRPDGTTRTARMLPDTGGGGFLLTDPLARELGVTMGPSTREDGQLFASVTSPVIARLGPVLLALTPQRIAVMVGRDNVLPTAAAGHAEGMIPGHVLARYHVVFDYPARALTLAAPGVLTPRGTPLPMRVGNASRYPGAFGEAATLGGATLETMMLPQGQWGPFALGEVGVTSQREGTFERYMSGMMRAPIVGSLAGNVLKSFRVELDYAHERLFLSRP
jgi:hypothetical protein